MAPPRRIPPPPTKFAPASGQPKAALPPARGVFAPPPVHLATGTAQRQAPARPAPRWRPAPHSTAQRKPVPPTGRRGASAVIQRAVLTTSTNSTGLPMAQRPVVKCTMGQGVIGQLDKVVLHSDRFSSCTPIILFNADSGRGGLFHFAAEQLAPQRSALWGIFAAVTPTEIWIGDRSVTSTGMGLYDAAQTDPQALKEYFEQECLYPGKIAMLALRAQQYYVTADDKGELLILLERPKASDVDIDYTFDKKPDIPETAKDAMFGVVLFGKNRWVDGKPV